MNKRESFPIPVILFAYARPDLLRQTLDCLRANHIPLLYAFSDGARTPDKRDSVEQVRRMLKDIDWCEIILNERQENLGLGRSILTGVSEVLARHNAAIIFEDDLICVPGTYTYLTTALRHYANDSRVMSVTGWTHPRAIPSNVTDQPYFDGRAECLVWGTWARAWQGMDRDALGLMRECEARGIDTYRYGADLPEMARVELQKNIWAVRFTYWHILNRGLCLRPPWSMVEHIGWGEGATNASTESGWQNPPLGDCPPIPSNWGVPVENPACARLWRKALGSRPTWRMRLIQKTRFHLAGLKRKLKALSGLGK
jgi:hypothetical protein